VVPSIWYENSPYSILEAFAHGLPVIATDLGGMAELVRHEESGLLFRRGDAASLAQQLARLLREPSLLGLLRSGVPPVKASSEEIDEIEHWCLRFSSGRARAHAGSRP
jgi:glycosyltransferase involved in cell wall biosynthesis